MTIQYKTIDVRDIDLKMEGGSRKFRGYAATFNGVDSYGDTILPGAFAKTFEKGMPKMFFGHKWDLPIGKWLSAVEDEKGLLVEGELTEGNPQSDAVLAALRHGTIDGLSIGFKLGPDDYERKFDHGRNIKSVSRLFEISVVSFPADGDARIAEVRSEDIEDIKTIRDLEGFLRDAGGFSKTAAATLIAKAKAIFSAQRDAETEAKNAQTILERLKALELSMEKRND